ncbi:hypothetical protein CEXT_126631 [Caerostris extrusa]|uniref:Uncharacterized protein n=1 Tax=Caerostris extrusa TaxID=172846 RepID=A0AAV4P089_CAEEX|nr:hypothetical protein CEXT_126631 [Caerostris extrusa]
MPTPLRKPLKNEPHRKANIVCGGRRGKGWSNPPGRHMVGLKSSATAPSSCVWGEPRIYKTRAQHQDPAHSPA